MSQRPSRRVFLRTASLAATLVPTVSSWLATPAQAAPNKSVRLGIIGTGSRGRAYIREALSCPDVHVSALCDTDPDAIRQALLIFDALGKPHPTVYSDNGHTFRQLCQREDVDGLVIAAPDTWHTSMAITAMKAGKPVGIGLSVTTSLADSWALVDTFEQTGTSCMLLAGTCYHPDTLAVLGQIRQGDFGKLTYARSGYQQVDSIYPTHGLGPVAQWLAINRGNQFTSLSSTASRSRGLRPFQTENGATGSPVTNYMLGHVITTTIQCANGATVELIHDSGTPRPYANGFRVQGSTGSWTSGGQAAPESQNNADALVMHDFIKSVRNKTMPPIDVYDAALWRCIHSLAEQSLAAGGQTVAIPDFTRGKWQTNTPVFDRIGASIVS